MGAILEGKRACNENSGPQPTLLYSEASFPRSANGWGGARNRSGRASEYIKLEAALELVEAARWAFAAGVPFNRHLTVHWAIGGVADNRAAGATGRLIKLIGDWVKKRSGRYAYSWVRETGPRKGSHVHILLHIPKGITLGHMTSRWFKSITGKACKGAVRTRSIGGSAKAAFSGSDWYEDNLAAVVAYLLKGVSVEAGETLGLDRAAAGGWIIGKRISISQNLRPAGRGWANPCNLRAGQRPETPVQTLTPIFSCASHAPARARPEPENQNFADDLGKSGEAA